MQDNPRSREIGVYPTHILLHILQPYPPKLISSILFYIVYNYNTSRVPNITLYWSFKSLSLPLQNKIPTVFNLKEQRSTKQQSTMATATIVHDDCEVGFEEGMLWLPSYVLDEVNISRLIHQMY